MSAPLDVSPASIAAFTLSLSKVAHARMRFGVVKSTTTIRTAPSLLVCRMKRPSTLKFEGRFILQTKSDGAVRMVVVDFTTPNRIRACATFDSDKVKAAIDAGETSSGALMGRGHLAMTIDQGPDMSRYQGVVPLDGGSLEAAAHEYFRRSEQIPTRW